MKEVRFRIFEVKASYSGYSFVPTRHHFPDAIKAKQWLNSSEGKKSLKKFMETEYTILETFVFTKA